MHPPLRRGIRTSLSSADRRGVAGVAAAVYTPGMRRNVLLTGALSFAFVVSGCECQLDDNNFTQLLDAGFPEPDAGPPPPVFPLKVGDQLTIPQFGGRVDTCEGGATEGACDRNVSASWLIEKVERNDNQRWEITADVVYTGLVDTIPASALTRLAMDNAADFGAISTSSSVSAQDAVFTTDVPAGIDPAAFGPNNFPFFQGENDLNDGDDGSVFNAAATEFTEAVKGLDPDAEVETQLGAGKFEAFFKDEVNGPVSLHKLAVQVHPMGFVCGWDEALIPYTEGMQRSQSSFQNVANPPLIASFFQPRLTRDNVSYQCSCFSLTCRANGNLCLDPTDPDAPPSECP
jgi:hypothetical protein